MVSNLGAGNTGANGTAGNAAPAYHHANPDSVSNPQRAVSTVYNANYGTAGHYHFGTYQHDLHKCSTSHNHGVHNPAADHSIAAAHHHTGHSHNPHHDGPHGHNHHATQGGPAHHGPHHYHHYHNATIGSHTTQIINVTVSNSHHGPHWTTANFYHVAPAVHHHANPATTYHGGNGGAAGNGGAGGAGGTGNPGGTGSAGNPGAAGNPGGIGNTGNTGSTGNTGGKGGGGGVIVVTETTPSISYNVGKGATGGADETVRTSSDGYSYLILNA